MSEMEGASSSQRDVKSSQEIEEEVKSIQTVTWDPFTVLPKEIYLKIFDMLDSSSDKQNFMNAHVKWHNLFESKRTLFLFEDVLKEIAKQEDWSDIWWKASRFQKFQHCRLVCHDWDSATQKYFQLDDSYFMIKGEDHIWGYSSGDSYVPCKSFSWKVSGDVEKDLKIFSITHPPSKNPFFSRSITLDTMDWEGDHRVGEKWCYRSSVDTLLGRYGRHIWHCKIKLGQMTNRRTNSEEYMRILTTWLDLMPELKTLAIHSGDWVEVADLIRIQNMQLVLPEMKNLVFLRTDNLQAPIFNKLFGNLEGLEKIQLQLRRDWVDSLRNFEMSNRGNLKEANLPIKGVEDFKYLESSESFPNLKKLFIQFLTVKDEGINKACGIWPEWKLIFKIMEEKFPALEVLTLKLPKAVSEKDKRAAIDHSVECQLVLPKLKKLTLNVSNPFSLDFLHSCKALLELSLVMGAYDWGLEEARDFRIIRKGEIEDTYFNMDFSNMWESTIWTACPKLRKLRIDVWNEGPKKYIDGYVYEKVGQDRKYRYY